MKKLLFLLIAIAGISCTGTKTETANDAEAVDTLTSKTLVAYFSATGTTRAVAEIIAAEKQADLFEIEPKEVYTDADLDWTDESSRSTVEMKDTLCRPEMKAAEKDFSAYDTLYVGYPIWWGVAPRIINTFLDGLDLTGKTVIPFATSGGSGVEQSVEALKKEYPAAHVLEGLLLNDPSQVAASIK